MGVQKLLIPVMAVCLVFLTYSYRIYANSPDFDTDEIYWIYTANITRLLARGDTTNTFWNEYYGFTNFNTAKLIYGSGLTLLGHTDFSQTGTPPETYYRWAPYAGKRFPTYMPIYRTLQDARLISAFFAATSAALLAYILYTLNFGYMITALTTAGFAAHPILMRIATHALADSFFLFFELLSLALCSGIIARIHKTRMIPKVPLVLLGSAVSLLTATKINGIIFLPFYCTAVCAAWYASRSLRNHTENSPYKEMFTCVSVMMASFLVTFLVLHPNLFFYPGLTLPAMIQNRIRITHEHIAYFSVHNPHHVLGTLQSRIYASVRHLFPVWLGVIMAAACAVIFVRKIPHRITDFRKLLPYSAGLLFSWMCAIGYTAFDEPRYFLPALPFIYIVCAGMIRIASGNMAKNVSG